MHRQRSNADKARELDNQIKAWDYSIRGYSVHQIANGLSCSTKTVQRILNREHKRRATFPSDLSPAEITKTRQIQSELLLSGMAKVVRQIHLVESDPKTSTTDKLFAISAGLRALSAWPR
jgi:IS30 family transposase